MATALRWVAIAASVGVLVGSLRSALRLRVGPTEERIFRLVNDASDAFHAPLWVVMQAGSLGAVWLTGGALWLGDDHAAAAMSVVGGTAIWGGVKLVKRFVGRGRPAQHLGDVTVRGTAPTGLGYPSGHAAIALTLALVATAGAAPGVQVAGLLIAALTGLGRIYVGAHLPLDILGGFSIGGALGSAGALALTTWA